MNDADSEQKPLTSRAPYWVSVYHVAVIIAATAIAQTTLSGGLIMCEESKIFLYSVCFGALGGTLTASRWVVFAVRHGTYDTKFLPWQLLTPIHSAVLAWVGVIAVKSGLLSLTGSAPVEPRYIYFVMAFSFLVGLASESFLERLISAAKSLFGEGRASGKAQTKEGKNDLEK